MCNSSYRLFVEMLLRAHVANNEENKATLAKFDTEFWALPVDFDVSKEAAAE